MPVSRPLRRRRGGRSRRSRAAATCGDAIEVPLIVLVDELLVYQAEVIDEPGAKMSTALTRDRRESASVSVTSGADDDSHIGPL